MRLLIIGENEQLARALGHLAPEARRLGRDALDLASPRQIAERVAEERPDVVINAAAYTAVDLAEREPEQAFKVNAEGVAALAEAAAAINAALTHISTDYVFRGDQPGARRETDPTDPVNIYGASKLEGERAALAANPRTVILRTAWVYSPWGKNFVRTMLRLGRTRDRLGVVADQTGQPTSALDLARACLAIAPKLHAAAAGDPLWGVYHFAGRNPTTWADFAEAVFQRAEGRLIDQAPQVDRISTSDYPTPAARPANSTLDLTRIEQVLGVAPRDWPEALDEALALINPEDMDP